MLPFNGDIARGGQYNEMIRARYLRIIDFVKMHYCLNQRTDSQFWIDNADPASLTETFATSCAMAVQSPPNRLDFVLDLEMYPPTSYQYVLYGMEFHTDLSASRASYPRVEEARKEFQMIQQVSQRALADVPTHRALVDQMCARAAPRASALV